MSGSSRDGRVVFVARVGWATARLEKRLVDLLERGRDAVGKRRFGDLVIWCLFDQSVSPLLRRATMRCVAERPQMWHGG